MPPVPLPVMPCMAGCAGVAATGMRVRARQGCSGAAQAVCKHMAPAATRAMA